VWDWPGRVCVCVCVCARWYRVLKDFPAEKVCVVCMFLIQANSRCAHTHTHAHTHTYRDTHRDTHTEIQRHTHIQVCTNQHTHLVGSFTLLRRRLQTRQRAECKRWSWSSQKSECGLLQGEVREHLIGWSIRGRVGRLACRLLD
jgi:hypothetical protein